jgi:glycosyltransferase involved in cell wall biosynthesis
MNIIQSEKKITISVVTATFNAATQLPKLVESLRAQTDKDFEWLVADGGSTDDTISLLNNITDLNLVISSQPDFGIYDAINRAIGLAKGDYYVVIGADDFFFPNAIADFRRAAFHSDADIVAAGVLMQGHLLKIKEGKTWLYGLHGLVSQHSVGTLIRKKLHEKFGPYSKKFPIAADQFFVMQACAGGATRHVASFTAGNYGSGGVSTCDYLGMRLEFCRVQILTGHNKFIQLAILFMKLIANYSRI